MADSSDVKKMLATIKEQDVKYVDFPLHRSARQVAAPGAYRRHRRRGAADRGREFDGSSIAGWKAINESDMTLMPRLQDRRARSLRGADLAGGLLRRLRAAHRQPYARDPRSIAKHAEAYLKTTGIGDTAFFGPEAEFFVFDDVRYEVSMNRCFYEFDSDEGPYGTGKVSGAGQPRPPSPDQGRLLPGAAGRRSLRPARGDDDDHANMACEIEKHHHEVAPRASMSFGLKFSTLVKCADNMQIYKYVVHNVAHSYGKTATFMPKPVKGDNGSGMHCHQSIWKGGKPLFAGSGYADLSDTALLLHRRHHQACEGAERLHQPDHQQLQATHSGLRGAGAASLFIAQTARPPAAFRTWRVRRASASRCASRSVGQPPISPTPPC